MLECPMAIENVLLISIRNVSVCLCSESDWAQTDMLQDI